MLFIIGLAVVFGSVLGGFVLHHGDLRLLWQPEEMLIIMGSAVGATLIANPMSIVKQTLKDLSHLFKTQPKSKADYLQLLSFFFSVFKLMKTKGMLEIESHIENPNESELFNQAPSIVNDHVAKDFIRDYIRVMTMGIDNSHQMESLMEQEIEIIAHEEGAPGRVFQGLADALPALGIVAAVLGVITTMKSISEPPAVLGGLIGAALVGTFLGVLLAYGIFGPIGTYLLTYAEARVKYFECIKVALISHISGNAPIITVEFIRKNIPEHLRPSFQETDALLNGTK